MPVQIINMTEVIMREWFKTLKNSVRESSGYDSVIELFGLHELIVTGCIEIIDLNDSEVLIGTVNGNVLITGKDLCIKAYRADILCIKGTINSVKVGDRFDS